MINEYTPDHVSPPGETLLEALVMLGVTRAELAERTGESIETIGRIIEGNVLIASEMALRLERVLSIPVRFWINRERQYRGEVVDEQTT